MKRIARVVMSCIIFMALALEGQAESYSSIDLDVAVRQANYIALVRILSAEFNPAAALECRFRYRVKVLEKFKGASLDEFYSAWQAVVGSRYLIIAKGLSACDPNATATALVFPGSSPLFPVVPYGWDREDDESWIVLGPANFRMPAEVRRAEGDGACYIPSPTGSVNPCPMPPPIANLRDVKEVLRRLSGPEDF